MTTRAESDPTGRVASMPTLEDILGALRRAKVRYATELGLHLDLAKALADAGIPSVSEHRLSGKDRVDVVVRTEAGLVAVEVKVRGSVDEIDRQVARYAAHDEVAAVVIVSPLMRHSGVAREVCGKPVHVVIRAEGAFL